MKPLEELIDRISSSQPNDAEQQLYALLHHKYGHTDPYLVGVENMAKLVDALFKFLGKRYSGTEKQGTGSFDGLIPKNIVITFSEEKKIVVGHQASRGIGEVTLPKISNQKPEEEAMREERIGKEFYSSLPGAILDQVERVIRGMPEKARNNLLNEYGDNNLSQTSNNEDVKK
ncbi:MAG: hypothetical protein H8D23_27325 [Candidatus Brocadiales bacterium]|nr:hypothetical protein [Candidatus Brocadiales bacterium]